ncbi:ThiF family adenylyltransferase [Bifidobacterium mongoliense]|uniref:ThiF family adenylyltransferase n=1 Tax=Bifidobacterium mongoliense TaxID=518643 RepID=UPI0030ECFD91
MTVDRLKDYVAYTRQHFEEGLIRAGFVQKDAGWKGAINHSKGTTDVTVCLNSDYPFQPPSVIPVDPSEVAWSWHRELNGALCLVAEDDHEGLWWTDPSAFLEQVKSWFDQADSSWPNDRSDLDLDRYFNPSDDRHLYLYDDLYQYRGEFVRFRPEKNNIMRISRGTRPLKTSKHSKDCFGYVANLGEVDRPPRSWNDISALINSSVNLERRIRSWSVEVLVLMYRRGTHDGAIVVKVFPTTDGGIGVRRLLSGADTEAARMARAGLLAPELQRCRVAIVGIGALGSFIADMLVRSGIRNLTLVDNDIVMPGNLIRHLVGPDMVGMLKTKAVQQHLITHYGIATENITTKDQALTSVEDSATLLKSHDVVVNATADFATTALLHVTAQTLSRRIISAAIQNRGTSYRIDLLPPLEGADPLPSSAPDTEHQNPEIFEAGCGSPISPTPPYVVMEAAAATVRHAVGLLTGHPLHPAGEIRNLSTKKRRIPE